METFYLETPSLERKNEIIDYINEFVEHKSDINGTGSLDKILDGYTFEQALESCLNMQYEEYAKKFKERNTIILEDITHSLLSSKNHSIYSDIFSSIF